MSPRKATKKATPSVKQPAEAKEQEGVPWLEQLPDNVRASIHIRNGLFEIAGEISNLASALEDLNALLEERLPRSDK